MQRKKQWLADNGLDDSVAVLFHGTRSDTVHEICSGNFRLDMGTRFAYGRGIYFSRCPNVSLDYGTDLILCKVLTGRKQPMARYEKLQVSAYYVLLIHAALTVMPLPFPGRITTTVLR